MSNIILAFDFGTKNIGVAVGQRITGTAYPLSSIKINNGNLNWRLIKDLLREWQPNEAIIGLPLNMDGTKQPFTMYVYKFANKIHQYFGLTVKMQDERLSTIEAKSLLFRNSGFRAMTKNKIDSFSAAIILESFLNKTDNL